MFLSPVKLHKISGRKLKRPFMRHLPSSYIRSLMVTFPKNSVISEQFTFFWKQLSSGYLSYQLFQNSRGTSASWHRRTGKLCCLSPGHRQLSYVEFRSSNCKTSPLTLLDGRLTAGKNFCASKPCDRTFISAVESVKARRTMNLLRLRASGSAYEGPSLH